MPNRYAKQIQFVWFTYLTIDWHMKTDWHMKKAYFKMQNVLVDDRRIWVDLYEHTLPPYVNADLIILQ